MGYRKKNGLWIRYQHRKIHELKIKKIRTLSN